MTTAIRPGPERLRRAGAPRSPLAGPELEYFLRAAEVGSLTKAAESLGIRQPSLTAAIQRLEKLLGTTLFVRGRRGVVLTSTGRVLREHATQALRTLVLAQEEIHNLEDEPRGSFTIGVHESLAAYLLPGFMARFVEKHPRVDLGLWNGNSREVQAAVVERRIDLGIVVNPQPQPECVVRPLFSDRVHFVIGAALARRVRPALPRVIAELPLVYVPALRQTQFLIGALAKRGLAPRRELPCSSLELVKSLVLDGVGVGILPWRVATHGVAKGRIVVAARDLPHYQDAITLVRRYDMHVTKTARMLLDALEEHGRAMPALTPE